MKKTSTRDMLVLALAWGLTACGGLAAADGASSESNSTIGPTGSLAACTNRGAQCDWEITKCKADPACARWYACVSVCDANAPQACFQKCQATTTAPSNASALTTCLEQGCLQGNKEVGGGAGSDYGGAAGAGPGGMADGGVNDGFGGVAQPSAASWENCFSCIYSGQSTDGNGQVVMDCQTQCNQRCDEKLSECQAACANSNETCLSDCSKARDNCNTACGTAAGTYKHVIGNNVPGEGLTDTDEHHNGCLLQTSFEAWDKCIYDSVGWVPTTSWQTYVTTGVHACVMSQCASVCIPKGTYQTCSSCLVDKCSMQSDAYWKSPDAQAYGWCTDYCPTEAHTTCNCQDYAEGIDILTQFVMCREQNCYDQCSN